MRGNLPVMTCIIIALVVSACTPLKKLFTPLPAREVLVDERPPREEITHVYVYNFAEKLEKPAGVFRLRSNTDRAWDLMEEGFKRGIYGYFTKHPVQVAVDDVRDLKHKGGSEEAYIARHLDTERSLSAQYRLVLDPHFYYREYYSQQQPEGSFMLTVSLTRSADNKVVWEAVYRRWATGDSGYSWIAQELAEQSLTELFSVMKQ